MSKYKWVGFDIASHKYHPKQNSRQHNMPPSQNVSAFIVKLHNFYSVNNCSDQHMTDKSDYMWSDVQRHSAWGNVDILSANWLELYRRLSAPSAAHLRRPRCEVKQCLHNKDSC